METPSAVLALVIAGFAAGFPLLWCGILLLLSRVGGWHRLAQAFPAGGRPASGIRHGHQFGRVGLVSYRGVLTVHVAEDGFFLEVMVLFRPGHPRLFIPWEAIRGRSTARLWLWSAERIEIGSPVVAVATLPSGLLPKGNGESRDHQ